MDYWTPETRLELIGIILDMAGDDRALIFPADSQLIYYLVHGNSDFLDLNRFNYREAIAMLEYRRTGEML